MPDDTFVAGVEVEDGMTRDFGIVGTLIHNAGVGDISTVETNLFGDSVADKGTKIAGVFALDASMTLFFHKVVDTVATTLAGTGEASTTHHDGNFVGADTMAFHHIEDGILAIVELVGHFVELLNLFNRVRQVLGKYLSLAFVDGSLGGGCAGVDD